MKGGIQSRVESIGPMEDSPHVGSALKRRDFLQWLVWGWFGVVLPLAGMGGCDHSGVDCSDDEMMTTPQRALRASSGYTENSPHGDERNCAACQFFELGAAQICGSCQILGGPVNPAGHCNSWAART